MQHASNSPGYKIWPHVVDLSGTNIITHIHGFIYDDHVMAEEVCDWLFENTKGDWYNNESQGYTIEFEYEQDAILFKLTWC